MPEAQTEESPFAATLLGTGTPVPSIHRFGPCTMVEVGGRKFLFDAGRGAMQRLRQLSLPFSEISGIFLTHHHSDHVVGFPDLWLTGWIGRDWGMRSEALRVWGPTPTREMMGHLARAFRIDIDVRRHSYSHRGVVIEAEDIAEGLVYNEEGLAITAFKVDHGGETLLAYGYRIDYGGRSVVISGDTTYNENLIEHSTGTDLLIHEVTAMSSDLRGRSKNFDRIVRNHTSPELAGQVFARVSPRLAVYTHVLLFGEVSTEEILQTTRSSYGGDVMVGEDLLRLELTVGGEITSRRWAE